MQSQTVNSIITRAYYLSGVLGDNETMNPSQATNGLLCLQELIDSWNADNLNIFTINILMRPVIGNQTVYTFGPGGDFDLPTRPADVMELHLYT